MDTLSLPLLMLVVDDDDVDRERVLRLLARSPLQADVKEAASGAEALQLVRQHAFDCVMLDHQLGDASGAELLPQLRREASRDCPIIMITGAGSEALAVQALHDGASDYLAKARLSVESLVRSVRRSIEHHRLQSELDAMHRQLEQRVEAQAATIRQSERDLLALSDHSPTVMGYWDQRQHCRFGNQAHLDWFGLAPGELAGLHLRKVLGAKLYADCTPQIEAALMGEPQHFECSLQARDGRPARQVQAQFLPDQSEQGDVRGFYVAMNDVTAIKQAQARAEDLLRFSDAVIENSPIGMAVYRANGPRLVANAAFVETFRDVLGDEFGDDFRHCPPWRDCGLLGEALNTLADGLTRRIEPDLPGANGRRVQVACALARVDRGGEPHLLLMAHDVTAQRQAHQALVAARDAAESATRAKSAFLANMSHEIRTPMNAIVGLSRLALESQLPPMARDYLDKVHTSSVALMGILDDILDYSKIEAGHLHFERMRVDLAEVLRRVADLFQARIEQKALAFDTEVAPQVPQWVMADPLRLSQVLTNLVGNALKFTDTGRIVLKLTPVPPDAARPDGPTLRFAVSDTGLGIAPERRAALFDAFVQGDASVTRRFGGTGLGLAICKRLVQMMGGEIGVDSEAGQGSEFWFTARLEAADAREGADAGAPWCSAPAAAPVAPVAKAVADDDPVQVRAQLLRAMAAPLRGAHVLLAEDNEVNQIVASELLRRAGMAVTVVGDGAQAVASVRQAEPGHYAAVLMDLHMPVMDGLEATRAIRALPQGSALPIIGMTAAVLPEDRARCLEAGMVDHLSKPVIPEHVIRSLLKWLPARPAASPAEARAEAAALPMPAARRLAVLADPKVLDLAGLLDRLQGNETLLWKLLAIFVGYEIDTAAALTAMLARGDTEGALRKAHACKGSAANLGAKAIARACADLEQAIKQGGDVEGALARLRHDLPATIQLIQNLLRARSPGA